MLTCLLLLMISTIHAQNNPLANPASVVKSNPARFTVLTSGLIRMEWDSTGRFEDNASLIVINRNLPKPDFKVKETKKQLVIATDKLTLTYTKSSERFNEKNLSVTFNFSGKKTDWNLAVKDTGNLLGTMRTLDGWNGDKNTFATDNKVAGLETGLISKNGWFLLDDAKSYLFDSADFKWVKERASTNNQDLYLFAYGTDYKSVIYDYTLVAGKVPLPPRYAFGYWWSRYYNYSDYEYRDLIEKFQRYNVPLDVSVLDMDWHTSRNLYVEGWKNAKTDLSGTYSGWTGYTWDKRLFPNPNKFLQWANNNELKVTLNLHPAAGVPRYEEIYPQFAKAMNFDTTGTQARIDNQSNPAIKKKTFEEESYKDVPFEATDKKFISTLFDMILHPLQKSGVSFWWLDWQQYDNSKILKNLPNIWWLNHIFFTDMEVANKQRPLIYHRWGGLGNHRYQIGFSGDSKITWNTLAFQPYFTATAANVLYGYWSHDIGGHVGSRDSIDKNQARDPELYMRWLQYGVFNPILRTHSVLGAPISREPWDFAFKYQEVITDFIRYRYSIAPYIYTMARKTHETGISLCRPLYYDYPEDKESYENKSQYMFGDDMLIAPIVEPSKNDKSTLKVWLPKGEWYELFTGYSLKGNQRVERTFGLKDYPVYIKTGSILPTYPVLKNLKHNCDSIILKVYGRGNADSKLYEDAGDDNGYKSGAFTNTFFTSRVNDEYNQTISISPRTGSFGGASSYKTYTIQLHGYQMPEQVTVNGKKQNYNTDADVNDSWHYNLKEQVFEIALPATPVSEKIDIKIKLPNEKVDVDGLSAKLKKVKQIVSYLKTGGIGLFYLPTEFIAASELDVNILYNPTNYNSLVNNFNAAYNQFLQDYKNLPMNANNKMVVEDLLK